MYNQIDSNKRRTWALIAIFVVFVIAVGYVFSYILGYGSEILVFAVILSLIMSLFSYYGGDKVALSVSGAKQIEKNDNPYLYRMVENLCISSGMPLPKIHIIPDSAINAFATGRDPKHASVAITQGAIDKLENEELEGVLAHELSHVNNYDIRLMMIVIVLVGIIGLLADLFIRFSLFGGLGGRKKSQNQGGAIMLIIGLIAIILAPIVAQLIKLAISRKREYLADASGALMTRYPNGLANALEKIKNQNIPLKKASTATAHLFIANPFQGGKKVMAKLFSTHPPIDERINKLRKMA